MKKQNSKTPQNEHSPKITRPKIPYRAGNPIIDPNGFFGREDIFRDVMNMLRSPHDFAIGLYGQRRIGKTSVLLQLKHRLAEEGEFTPVYFNLEAKAAKPLGDVLYDLAKEIARVTDQSPPERNQFDDNGDYFRHEFIPISVVKAAPGGLVLLFDEFDVLEEQQGTIKNQADQTFFPYLQEWMTEFHHVKFCFAIGRRQEHLSSQLGAFFKGARYAPISTLDQKDSEAVIRQSERDGSLYWTDAAVKKVWGWTQGHAFLTQLLCRVIWERAYDNNPSTIPQVEPTDVDSVIDKTLKEGDLAFDWIWQNLPPAEKVVMAAMAEAGDAVITRKNFHEILLRSGVRYILPELEPTTLVKWELLREAEGGHRFAVALLRCWVAANHPLRRVKEQLDHINKPADMLYQTAVRFYDDGNRIVAEDLLNKALASNRNHLKAMVLLGNVLFETNRIDKAVETFQQAYNYDQTATAAQAGLIKALLALADQQSTDSEQLATYDRILKVDSAQPIALEGRQKIWISRGEKALEQNNFDDAIANFKEAGDNQKAEDAIKRKRRHEYQVHLNMAEMYEKEQKWSAAVEKWNFLIENFADLEDQVDFQLRKEYAESQASLDQRYDNAVIAFSKCEYNEAKLLFAGIVTQQLDYKDALWHLVLAQTASGIEKDNPDPLNSTFKIIEKKLESTRTEHTKSKSELPSTGKKRPLMTLIFAFFQKIKKIIKMIFDELRVIKKVFPLCKEIISHPKKQKHSEKQSQNKAEENKNFVLIKIRNVLTSIKLGSFGKRIANFFARIKLDNLFLRLKRLISSISWKHLGLLAILVACIVAIILVLRIPSKPPTSEGPLPPIPVEKVASFQQLANSLIKMSDYNKGDDSDYQGPIFRIIHALNDSLEQDKTGEKTEILKSMFNTLFYSNTIELLNVEEKKDSIASFFGSLQDLDVLSPICKKFASMKEHGKINCLRILDKFDSIPDKEKKLEINKFLAGQNKERFPQVNQLIRELLLKFPSPLPLNNGKNSAQQKEKPEPIPPPVVTKKAPPPVSELIKDLKKAFSNGNNSKISQIIDGLLDSVDTKDFKDKYSTSYDALFDDVFYSEVSNIFNKNDNFKGDIVKLLCKLQHANSRSIIFKLFLKSNPEGKKSWLEVLKGFKNSNLSAKRDIKTWLEVEHYFEGDVEIAASMQQVSLSFALSEIPLGIKIPPKVKELFENLSKTSIEEAANAALGSVEHGKPITYFSDAYFGEAFYNEALGLLKNNNDNWIGRSIALFLSKLQNDNEKLCIKVQEFWNKNSEIEARRLYVVILSGIIQDVNRKKNKKTVTWLQQLNTYGLPQDIINAINRIAK